MNYENFAKSHSRIRYLNFWQSFCMCGVVKTLN